MCFLLECLKNLNALKAYAFHCSIRENLNPHDVTYSFCKSSIVSYAQYYRAGGYLLHVYLAPIVTMEASLSIVFFAFLAGIEALVIFKSRLYRLIVISNESNPHKYVKN